MKIGFASPLPDADLLPWCEVEPGMALLVGLGGTDTTTLPRGFLQNEYHATTTPFDPLLETPVILRGDYHLRKDLQLVRRRIGLSGRTSLRIRAPRHDDSQGGQSPDICSQRNGQQPPTPSGRRSEPAFDQRTLPVRQVARVPSLVHPTRSLSARRRPITQALTATAQGTSQNVQRHACIANRVTGLVKRHDRPELRRPLQYWPISRTLDDPVPALPLGESVSTGTQQTASSVCALARFLAPRAA